MSKKIAIIVGHPDPAPERYCRALANAYAEGAAGASHEIRRIDIGTLDIPLLKSQMEWKSSPLPPSLIEAQQALLWADHIVIIYPLWLGDVPAKLKAFLEQVLRPGEALSLTAKPFDRKPLSGKSARVVVTMGMPALLYRWGFGAHSLKSLKRNVLWFVGVKPIRDSVIGIIEAKHPRQRLRWLERMREMGRSAC